MSTVSIAQKCEDSKQSAVNPSPKDGRVSGNPLEPAAMSVKYYWPINLVFLHDATQLSAKIAPVLSVICGVEDKLNNSCIQSFRSLLVKRILFPKEQAPKSDFSDPCGQWRAYVNIDRKKKSFPGGIPVNTNSHFSF